MTIAVLLLLAAVQGLCEFLPVSSSGHLALVQRLLGFSEPPVLFNVSLHVGTLVAILALYRREAWASCAAGWRWLVRPWKSESRWRSFAPEGEAETEALGIVLATVVTGVLALPFAGTVERASGNPLALGILFFCGGVLLGATRWAPRGAGALTLGRAALIGVAQAVAVLPGISRSGLTIAAALFLGIEPAAAARFAFLIAVPAILGAEVVGALGDLGGAAIPAWQHVVGAVFAAGVGVFALWTLVALVRRRALYWFAPYLLALGIAVLVFVR
ncbi:MAG: undecaprenyl-diphosphate phosphatase [Deltaproteobacteria bacterium]|nr:undecaprenyl-diphosphate phosphatase [Deltaproteobacteria bacterium]